MTGLVVENLRLKELVLVVNKNKPFFDEFVCFIGRYGYADIHAFVSEDDEQKAGNVLSEYFREDFDNSLFDGIARPYNQNKSKWYFIAWLLRDAPQQRLQPIVSDVKKGNTTENRIWVINEVRKFVAPLLPGKDQWQWPAIAEVMLQRLEGSRRALKGSLFEAIVRAQLTDLFRDHKISLKVTPGEVKINDETYDIEVSGGKQKILMPVKTRETMGGGHALLFTRDIHKSITVADASGFICIPVVIAESWGGKLDDLPSAHHIHIPVNPNQVEKINPLLRRELEKLVGVFANIR